jgi:mannose-1-phosphate guanylyltransferase
MKDVWAVIMAGGIGSRFWPLSRAERPKQLLDLFGDGPMVRKTSERLAPLAPPDRQLVVTGRILSRQVRDILPELPAENILEEPTGRNTAPCIGWAALWIRRRDPNAIMMVLPADHHIADVAAYQRVCRRAVELARGGRIITVGIQPTRPETGYGYIQQGAPISEDATEVAAFKEKPDVATALAYLEAGESLWNAGMFFMPAWLVLQELEAFEPELMEGLKALDRDDVTPELLDEIYPNLKSISIDYAVMERTGRIGVLPGSFGWSDLGSWRTLWDFRPAGESTYALGDVIELDGGGNVLVADQGTIATIGVKDLIVVHTADGTLVVKREEAQRVKDVVAALKKAQRTDLL